MSNYTNDQLSCWQQPVSGSEDATILNVVNMVRDAINSSIDLRNHDIEVFLQGSYANNTNVRNNSDVDVNVCLHSTFYYMLPEGRTREQYGIEQSNYPYSTYKQAVYDALVAEFGQSNVQRKNKCIHIKENTYHHEADVVPTFEYRRYGMYGIQNTGTKFFCDDGNMVINYPKQQIENGTAKNNNTNRRFKRTVRILKRVRYKMLDEDSRINQNISSFLIESLLWNVPDRFFYEDGLNERLRGILCYLYDQATALRPMQYWTEESNLCPLFGNDRKWTIDDVRLFVLQVWNYLGYGK